ncbi:hypothetical protein Goshw_007525 [Gossypium schwendimanii]|uniref:Uncharacterized protein n=1 Tax=Gossypium schwendimanii TaxID=34291 RepID=A0A7J9N5N8_GOSSC|nr:hypothetical protein [Gossypium schwendimanii]
MCGATRPSGTIRQVMLDYLPLLKIYNFYWTNGRKHK